MSGGQQQRVALARALAISPRVLLLDEPLSALDAKVREQLRDEIRRIQLELGVTTVFVTHDQEEALSMADRVGVMRAGQLEQCAPPSELYDRPATPFVADVRRHDEPDRRHRLRAWLRCRSGGQHLPADGELPAAGANVVDPGAAGGGHRRPRPATATPSSRPRPSAAPPSGSTCAAVATAPRWWPTSPRTGRPSSRSARRSRPPCSSGRSCAPPTEQRPPPPP